MSENSVNAVPNIPVVRERSRDNSIKAATPDLIVRDKQGQPVEYLTDLLYEQIGGQEILSVSRADIINGQHVRYTPIKNLSSISSRYNSQNIFYVDGNWEEYFSNFAIHLEQYMPELGSGPNGEIIYVEDIFADQEQTILLSSSIVVELESIPENIDVEFQTVFLGDVFSDIIYNEES